MMQSQCYSVTVYCDNTASKKLNKQAHTLRKCTFAAKESSSRDSRCSIGRGSSSIYKKIKPSQRKREGVEKRYRYKGAREREKKREKEES